MAIPTIDALPEAPLPSDSPDVFNSKAFAFVDALGELTTQINAALEWINSVYAQDVVVIAATSLVLREGEQGQWLQFTSASSKTIFIDDDYFSELLPFAIFHIENSAASGNITFSLDGATLEPPAGGTNVIPPGAVASVKRTGETAFKLIGQVVAA